MVVLVTCKKEDDAIESKYARVATKLYNDFRCLIAANSLVGSGILLKCKHIKAIIITAMKAKQSKLKTLKQPHFFQYKSNRFSSAVHGQI